MLFLSALIKTQYPKFIANLETQLGRAIVLFKFLENTQDIWVRDYLPVQVAPDQFVQFSLTQDYYYKNDRYKDTNPAPICKALGIEPVIPTYKGENIFLDGGNVIRGFGKAILTEKVFADNDIPPDDLVAILKEVLQVDQVIFIPVEPKDDTAHADGYVRFVDESTVVANDYSKIYTPKTFKDRFYRALTAGELKVLPVPYNPSDERKKGYQSAVGCYINFLQVGDKIFLPTFNDSINDDEAIKRFGEIFGSGNIIPVPSKEVALGGGVLNCLTWEIKSI